MVRRLTGQSVRPREDVLGLFRARACRSLVNEVSAVSNFVHCTSFDALPLSIAVVVAHRGQPNAPTGASCRRSPSSALFLSTSDSTRTVVPVVVAGAAAGHDRRTDY